MSALTTFDSTKESLPDLVRSIRDGKTQLPDFQRGWVWDDNHIRSLLASVSLSYPIGAVMLQTGNPEVKFKPRPVEGVELSGQVLPERLILDGQQRLTSLYQSLFMGSPVVTRDARDKEIRRWYYRDIDRALAGEGDRDESIIGLPATSSLMDIVTSQLAQVTDAFDGLGTWGAFGGDPAEGSRELRMVLPRGGVGICAPGEHFFGGGDAVSMSWWARRGGPSGVRRGRGARPAEDRRRDPAVAVVPHRGEAFSFAHFRLQSDSYYQMGYTDIDNFNAATAW